MSEDTMQIQFHVVVTLRRKDDYFTAKADVSARDYLCPGTTTLPASLIALDIEPGASRHPERAISYALAELAAKIGSGR